MISRTRANRLTVVLLIGTLCSASAWSAQEPERAAPEATEAQLQMSFRDINLLDTPFIDTSPAKLDDGIAVGKLGVDSGNKKRLVKLARQIAADNPERIDSLLIVHQGKLLLESYYLRGRSNLPHPQASATKSYTSMALGRAMALGYLSLADLDKPVVSFLKDLDPSRFVPGAERITLHHALTMTTGVRIARAQWEAFRASPEQMQGQQQVQAMLEHSEPITPESQTFLYGTGPELIMQVIDAVVPGTAQEFIQRELLDKLAITNYVWRTDISGLPVSGSRTSMTARDMVKWGTLAANNGQWNGEQLIPAAYLERAMSPIIYPGDDDIYGGGPSVSKQCYGYFFWCADLNADGQRYFSTSAQGGGGQYIIFVDALDLMVVVTAHENDNSRLQMVAEQIIPAFAHAPKHARE